MARYSSAVILGSRVWFASFSRATTTGRVRFKSQILPEVVHTPSWTASICSTSRRFVNSCQHLLSGNHAFPASFHCLTSVTISTSSCMTNVVAIMHARDGYPRCVSGREVQVISRPQCQPILDSLGFVCLGLGGRKRPNRAAACRLRSQVFARALVPDNRAACPWWRTASAIWRSPSMEP